MLRAAQTAPARAVAHLERSAKNERRRYIFRRLRRNLAMLSTESVEEFREGYEKRQNPVLAKASRFRKG